VKHLATVSSNIETSIRSKEFVALLRCYAAHHGDVAQAARTAKVIGLPRIAETLETVNKTATDPGTLSSWSAVAPYTTLADAWIETLRSVSVFDAMLAGGMRRVPLRARFVRVTTAIASTAVSENSVKPISSLALGDALIDPVKAAAIVIISEELLRLSNPSANSVLDAELRGAVIAATDQKFLADLVAATTPTPSAGSTLAQIVTDLGVLLGAVSTGAGSKLFYITSPTNMKKLSMKASTTGAPAIPLIGPNGGQLMPDVSAIASDQVGSGVALMVDATGIVGNSDALVPSMARQATLEFATTPDSPPTAATVFQNLWARNQVALRVERFFAFEIGRTSAVASLSSVAY
jgi:hypothetical protein